MHIQSDLNVGGHRRQHGTVELVETCSIVRLRFLSCVRHFLRTVEVMISSTAALRSQDLVLVEIKTASLA
jgi:hypothetical protein